MNKTASFGYWVRRRRKALDMTQAELARRLGCAEVTIQKIEADERRPSRQMAELLADCLAITATERPVFVQSARAERSVDALPLAPPPVHTAPAPQSMAPLPSPPTPFVGRQRILAEIRQLLRQTRLLTLTGTGGTGKTRVALQIAYIAVADFADGACFVDLGILREADAVAQTLVDQLGISSADHREPAAILYQSLRHKQLLVVLDNFEHLLAAASLIGDLLEASPGLKFLVTSRQPLHIYGEQEYPVPPMTVPVLSRPELWPALVQSESVALFLQRAQAVKPTFQLSADNAQPIVAICRRLDGLPLALELAAARMKSFGVQELLQRLDRQLALLTGGARDLPLRQQTLLATIDWSYALLTAEERAIFASLALFANGFTLTALEAVVDDERGCYAGIPVVDLLDGLIDKSLVQHNSEGDESRYTLLGVIYEYAQEKLAEQADKEQWRRRHLRYYTQLAEAAERYILGVTQAHWLHYLAQEHDNLRTALQWSVTAQAAEDKALGLRLAGALGWFWHLRGYWREGRHWVQRLLAQTAQSPAQAKALAAAGLLAWAQDDYSAAKRLLQTGLELLSPGAPTATLAHIQGILGLVFLYELQLEQAQPLFAQSLAHFRHTGDLFGIGLALLRLGIVARLQGQWDSAAAASSEALHLYRQLDNAWGISTALANLGEIALDQSDWQQAARAYQTSLKTIQTTGSQWYLALHLVGSASVAVIRGEPAIAVQLFGVADMLFQTVGGRIPPVDRLLYDQYMAKARALLSPEAFHTAYTAGQDATPSDWEPWVDRVLHTDGSEAESI